MLIVVKKNWELDERAYEFFKPSGVWWVSPIPFECADSGLFAMKVYNVVRGMELNNGGGVDVYIEADTINTYVFARCFKRKGFKVYILVNETEYVELKP